jgi:transposase InsO family protein
VKFRAIQMEKANFPISMMCGALGVSRSGFAAFDTRSVSAHASADARLAVEVTEIFNQKRKRYGSPRIQIELESRGQRHSRKRIARLMRAQGLCARSKRRFKKTTIVDPSAQPAPNLLDRQFHQEEPNIVWVSDITYIWTLEGWLYLTAFLDLFSRIIAGWDVSDTPDAAMCIRAFERALTRRSPSPGLLVHSDRGCQYTSVAFQESVVRAGAIQSMSRKGNCWDNAAIESFWSSLKAELEQSVPQTRADARRRIFEYIEAFYNPSRLHSSLGYLSPVQFEAQAAAAIAA